MSERSASRRPRPARSGRRTVRLLIAAAVAVLGFATLVALRTAVGGDGSAGTGHQDAAPASPAVPVPPPADLPPVDPPPAAPSAAGQPAGPAGPVTVHYTFDGGAGRPIVDTKGRHPLRIAVVGGGGVGFQPRENGWAITLPGRCTAEPARCPRSILQGSPTADLNPGTRPVRLGASVRMTAADTSDGANVVQKGYSVGGGAQIKLQVDGTAGRPSCVVASGGEIHRVVAPVRIADGAWHQLTCVRDGPTLSIVVDGVERGSVPVPARLSIVNAEPLRVGGKGTNPGNDQFSGQVDDVFLTIS